MCSVEAARLGDYDRAEQFFGESDSPEYWRERCAYAAMRKEVK
jgi:hypothetical protein